MAESWVLEEGRPDTGVPHGGVLVGARLRCVPTSPNQRDPQGGRFGVQHPRSEDRSSSSTDEGCWNRIIRNSVVRDRWLVPSKFLSSPALDSVGAPRLSLEAISCRSPRIAARAGHPPPPLPRRHLPIDRKKEGWITYTPLSPVENERNDSPEPKVRNCRRFRCKQLTGQHGSPL